jgi:7,8-dihydropterin-6-yl-methyl-4-(beta-D-ribofuranosyl)aminobenzene 5'-phosphate synthase
MRSHYGIGLLVVGLLARSGYAVQPPSPSRVTILYDAFGDRAGLTRDWGFAALVEYRGRRILFDTGNNAEIFAANIRALHVNLRTIDFVVVSHRHGDHTAGINYLLQVNPRAKIYAPRESFGVFGAALPGTFYRADTALPGRMRYFDGQPPGELRFGTPWPKANVTLVDSLTEVVPGAFIIATVSETPGTLELRELSLALQTSEGMVLLVGCSHPGIETILTASRPVADRVHLILGGLHLVTTPDTEIERITTSLHDQWHVRRIAPGHCTGEPAFAALQRTFGEAYVYAGLGTIIDLPSTQLAPNPRLEPTVRYHLAKDLRNGGAAAQARR